ncbi:hypothetical protein GOBAR_AA24707 [Gossypium barbadense]|uniref:Uncharacterized protein n=1 Tax=Gossypium barbadense TaxID=3634 RepID=A0A2P5WXZ0_GOSBA|nr:hypothetical protein GOBAR_AA24707 [Gossypium barbadense]
MLMKFISVSETRFQNTKPALKNQQASIQGLKTQIGQLAKLISERPQGSLPSNTESNPREQLNNRGKELKHVQRAYMSHAQVTTKGPIYEERRHQINELDEWQIQKPITHDKPKPRHDGLNVLSDQLKVGDKVLLDAAEPRIAIFEPNGAIPFTVLNIFPYGTVEVTHSKFSTVKVNSTRLKPYFDEIDSRNEGYKFLAPP